MNLENILSSIKKNAKKTAVSALTGITLLGSSTFYSPQVKAEDIIQTSNVSLITQLDNDGDGLTNEQEVLIGTNPDLEDSDGDKLGDGEEIGARYNPTTSDSPSRGATNTTRRFGQIQNLTSGLENSFGSTWLLREKIAYIEGDSIYVKNLSNLEEPRKLLISGLNKNELIELGSGPLGDSVYFHRNVNGKDVINKVNIEDGLETNVIPGKFKFNSNVRNPSVSGTFDINTKTLDLNLNDFYLVAETDIPDETHSQIYLFHLVKDKLSKSFGEWDGSNPIPVTNDFSKFARPKLSIDDGDKILIQKVMPEGKTKLLMYRGVKDIANKKTKPYNPNLLSTDLRGDYLVFENEGVAFPGGFGKGFAYWIGDSKKVFTLNNGDFNNSNFDIFTAPYGVSSVTGRFELSDVKKRLVLPFNEISLSVSPDGGRLAFSSDYLQDGTKTENFNIFLTSTRGHFRGKNNMPADLLNGFRDSSGISFGGNKDYHKVKNVTGLIGVEYDLNPISDINENGQITFSKRKFTPDGLEIYSIVKDINSANEGIYMKSSWSDQDLITSNGILDETTISVAWEEITGPSTALIPIPENQIIEKNLEQNYISFYTKHFSAGSLIGKLLKKEVTSDVVNWRMMDSERKEKSYEVIVGSSTKEYKPYVLELKPWEP